MRGVTAAVVCACVFGLLAIAACPRARAEQPLSASITVTGNQHIDAAMIRSHVPAGRGRLDATALDAALKSLYATGLFADVKITRQGDGILIAVIENPTVDRLAFEGNKKIKDEDLRKAVQSKLGGPLSRAIAHDDVDQIVELYRQRRYFDVKVDPQTIKHKSGRATLVFVITEGDKLAVRQVQFAGNEAFSATKLKGAIKTGESNVLSFFTDNDTYNADQIEADLGLIRRFYLNNGYADVRVRSSASYQADKKGVVVTFSIEEGAQYRLGRVDIVSNVKSVDAASLRSYLRTSSDKIYDADAVNKTAEDIATALAKNGVPFATAFPRSERLPGRGLINLVYAVEEGKRLYVERLDIHGNTKTRDDVIRREFDFVEGDAYNRALVDRASAGSGSSAISRPSRSLPSRARPRTVWSSTSPSTSKRPANVSSPAAIPPPTARRPPSPSAARIF